VLFRAGAFAGARREDAYFVRCDATTMSGNDLDNGRLVCLIGVAPAEPIEFIVVQLIRELDGTLRLAE
jgi:phage tail sheath protein FI